MRREKRQGTRLPGGPSGTKCSTRRDPHHHNVLHLFFWYICCPHFRLSSPSSSSSPSTPTTCVRASRWLLLLQLKLTHTLLQRNHHLRLIRESRAHRKPRPPLLAGATRHRPRLHKLFLPLQHKRQPPNAERRKSVQARERARGQRGLTKARCLRRNAMW